MGSVSSARQSLRPRRRWRTAGFTLVEMMVVIVLIGLLASAVVLSFPEPGGGLRFEAERFAARAKAAQEASIIGARAMSISVDAQGYGIAESRDGAWREVSRHDWEAGTSPELAGSGRARSRFDPTGIADPLALTLRRGRDRMEIVIGSDGDVRVQR